MNLGMSIVLPVNTLNNTVCPTSYNHLKFESLGGVLTAIKISAVTTVVTAHCGRLVALPRTKVMTTSTPH